MSAPIQDAQHELPIGSNGSVEPEAHDAPAGGSGEGAQPEDKATNWQSRYDKLVARMGPDLPRVLEKYDGRSIAAAAETLDRALKDQQLGPAIATWLTTGKVTLPQAAAEAASEPQDDPYEDPSVKQLREKVAVLEGMLQQNHQATLQTTYSQAARVLEEHNSAFLKRYPETTSEERDVFLQKLQSRLEGMIRANPQSFLKLDEKTHRMVALDVMEEVVPLDSLYERKLQAKKTGLASMATDSPLRAPTNGAEGPAKAASRLSVNQQQEMARQAMASAIARNRGA